MHLQYFPDQLDFPVYYCENDDKNSFYASTPSTCPNAITYATDLPNDIIEEILFSPEYPAFTPDLNQSDLSILADINLDNCDINSTTTTNTNTTSTTILTTSLTNSITTTTTTTTSTSANITSTNTTTSTTAAAAIATNEYTADLAAVFKDTQQVVDTSLLLGPTCVPVMTTSTQHNSSTGRDLLGNDYTAPNPDTLHVHSVEDFGQDYLMGSWQYKHPTQWSKEEVLDWVFCSMENENLDMSRMRGEAFQNIDGFELCEMTMEKFLQKEPDYGVILFQILSSLLQKYRQSDQYKTYPPLHHYHQQQQIQHHPEHQQQQHHQHHQQQQQQHHHPHQQQHAPHHHHLQKQQQQQQPYIPETYQQLLIQQQQPLHHQQHQSQQQQNPHHPHHHQQQQQQPQSNLSELPVNDSNPVFINSYGGPVLPSSSPIFPYYYPSTQFKQRKRPGRPKTSNVFGEKNIKRAKCKKRVKNQLLWEFLYDALKNPGYNPRFLKWENEVEGIFRFVQSEMMANVWGELKNNENMNYEKLSRAMRHYYRRGILERVEGRRLVYKFSRNAIEKLKLRSK
ncbi:hypothetical protein Ahia01_001122700 [Argonauta hians]